VELVLYCLLSAKVANYKRQYKILSLSGGGARGIYQAVYLRSIAESLSKPLCRNFDLIAGTSTGSIVAAGVAFDVNLDDIVNLFETRAAEIFSGRLLSGFRQGPRYNSNPLRQELVRVFNEKKLKEACTPLFVAATMLFPCYAPRQFSTFKDPGATYADPEFKLVDVIMASCAAPSYFEPHRLDHPNERRSYVDGGMWANSPSLDAVISAYHYEKKQFADIKVLSIGNGETVQNYDPEKFKKLRPVSKAMIGSLFDIMFAAQSKGADEMTDMLLPKGNFLRINSTLDEAIDLDDAAGAVSRLPAYATQDAAANLEKIVAFFGLNVALPYSGNPT
jgi:patatin-like phospholipase/acyl hydrolase